MTRIIAGQWRGRRLVVPRTDVRPTSERVREAVFNRLDHVLGGWQDRSVLDLYAGSGALGLEALSRGAARVTLVERDRGAAATIRRNVVTLGAGDCARVVPATVLSVLGRAANTQFDVVFADPPYDGGSEEIPAVLAALVDSGWLAPDAVVVVETGRRVDMVWPPGFTGAGERSYGDTRVWYGRRHTAPSGTDKVPSGAEEAPSGTEEAPLGTEKD